MRNLGRVWHPKPPRGVKRGDAYVDREDVYVLNGPEMSTLIARTATRVLAKMLAKAYNARRRKRT